MTVSSDVFGEATSVRRLPRLPRVAYSASVRLSGDWSDREPCFVPLLGQSLDVSEGGMSVVTPLQLQLGSAITCSMRVGGCQIYVVGSVVWERTGDDGMRRVGIRFLTPSDEDTGLMRRLLVLGKTHPHRVHVRFDGRPDTLTAIAQITRAGLELTAPLPILRRNTGVRFAFDPDGKTFHGRIDHVRLAQLDGMPALQVGIRVPDVSAMERAARGVEHDGLLALSSGMTRDDATPPGIEVPSPLPIAAREGFGASVAACARALRVNACARVLRVNACARVLRVNACARVLRSTLARWARELRWRVGASRVSTPIAALLSIVALGSGALVQQLSQPALEPVATLEPEPPSAAVIPPVRVPEARAPALRKPAVPTPALRPPAVLKPAALEAPSATGVQNAAPSFKWRRDRREIFVPLEGDLTQLHHFRMSSPAGIAIDVPGAQAPARAERYAVRRPGAHRIDIGPTKAQGPGHSVGGAKIRVWLKQPVDSYRVEATKAGVRVVLPGRVPGRLPGPLPGPLPRALRAPSRAR